MAISDVYREDEHGLHIRVTGTTETGALWTLREYLPQDFEKHWSIISENTGIHKLYPRDVSAGSKQAVQDRRERSMKRLIKIYLHDLKTISLNINVISLRAPRVKTLSFGIVQNGKG